MIDRFCDYCHRRHRVMLPLVQRLYDEGFVLSGMDGDGTLSLNEHLYEMRDRKEVAVDILKRFQTANEGELDLSLDGHRLLLLRYDDPDWFFRLHLAFINDKSIDLASMQHKLSNAYGPEDVETAFDAATEFLSENIDAPLHYELHTDRGAFLKAALDRERFSLHLVDVPAYLRIIFFFMQKADVALMVKSPLEILRLLEELQDMIQFLADSFADRNLVMEFKIEKEVVFRCGAGVKPTLGSRFGPTAIKLDALARILASAMPRRGE